MPCLLSVMPAKPQPIAKSKNGDIQLFNPISRNNSPPLDDPQMKVTDIIFGSLQFPLWYGCVG